MADNSTPTTSDDEPPRQGRRDIDAIRTTDPRIDIVIAAFIAQRLGWTSDDPVQKVIPLILDTGAEATYVIGAHRLLEHLDALALRDLVSANGEDALLAEQTRLDHRMSELTYERDWYRDAWQSRRDHATHPHSQSADKTQGQTHDKPGPAADVMGERDELVPTDTAPAAANTSKTTSVVTIDLATDHTLTTSLNAMDECQRHRLLSALRDAESADNLTDIVHTIRDVLRDEMPDDAVVGVLFSTDEYSNGHFLHAIGTVLRADGTTTEVDFHLDDVFTDEYGGVGDRCTLAVDLRDGTVTLTDTDWNSIHKRFTVTPPERKPVTYEADGITFDNAAARDKYLAVKALPEDDILYLAGSDAHWLKQRHDPIYRSIAGEDTNPTWVTHTAAGIAYANGWIDADERDKLTR